MDGLMDGQLQTITRAEKLEEVELDESHIHILFISHSRTTFPQKLSQILCHVVRSVAKLEVSLLNWSRLTISTHQGKACAHIMTDDKTK